MIRRLVRLSSCAGLALCIAMPHAQAQEVRYKVTSDVGPVRAHGMSVAAIGDVNGDGVADFLMGAPIMEWNPPLPPPGGAGAVHVCSGADGSTLRMLYGTGSTERFGASVAGIADIDGDGKPEILVGAPRADGNASASGVVRVFSGADGSALYTVLGDASYDEFGASLAALGDVDGDDVPDFAVGAPKSAGGGKARGSVRVVSGADGTTIRTQNGATSHASFGFAIAAIGDLDLDGKTDLLIGAPSHESGGTGPGVATVYSGATGATILTLAGDAPGDRFGKAVAPAGHVDADAIPDFMVGAPDSAYARVYSGAAGVELVTLDHGQPAYTSMVYALHGGFGTALAPAGDLDGDGVDDVAVSDPGASVVWMMSGVDGRVLGSYAGAFAHPFTGDSLSTLLGWSMASLGDLDGDGVVELVVGAPGDAPPPDSIMAYPVGCAVVISGGFDAATYFDALYETSSFGWAVSGVGDVNSDEYADIAIARLGGRVVVISGHDRSQVYAYTKTGGFGRCVASVGDVDDDGVGDFGIGAYAESGSASFSGGAWIYSGATGAELMHLVGSSAHDFFGTSISKVGDLNADGHDDFAVGAPQTGAHPSTGAFSSQPGYVRVFSGADGSVLREWTGASFPDPDADDELFGECFGFSVHGVGDWNRDGTPDLAIGIPSAGGHHGTGAARVYSGSDGSMLAQFTGYFSDEEFGICVSGGDDFDFDADGWRDLVVGSQYVGYGVFAVTEGYAKVYSGRDNHVLWGTGATYPMGYGRPFTLGYSVDVAGDFDRDGYSDVVVGNPSAYGPLGPGMGEIVVTSGRTHRSLLRVSGTSSWDYLGYSVAGVGDTNGDGCDDVLVGSPLGEAPSSSVSRARVWLGERRRLQYAPPKAR